MLNWVSKLDSIIKERKTVLCVGLDPQDSLVKKLGFDSLYQWGAAIIDATKDFVCAYKFQLAFYESLGSKGIRDMEKTIEYAKSSGVLLIGDAKRGDIGNTAEAYAKALFDTWKFDVVTVNPYLGFDSIKPFIDREDKGAFVVCRSSNNSASQIQDVLVKSKNSNIELYQHVYHLIENYDQKNNAGLVMGSTNLEPLRRIRLLNDDIPLLIPGIGAQGGVIEDVVPISLSKKHNGRCIFPISRGIIFPNSSKTNFEDYLSSVNKKADLFCNKMRSYISS